MAALFSMRYHFGELIAGLVGNMVVLYFVVWTVKLFLRKGKAGVSEALSTWLVLLLGFLLAHWTCPWMTNFIVYRGMLVHLPHALPAALGILVAKQGLSQVLDAIRDQAESRSGAARASGRRRGRARRESRTPVGASVPSSGTSTSPPPANGGGNGDDEEMEFELPDLNKALAVMYVVLGSIVAVAGVILVDTMMLWQICEHYTFQNRPELIEIDTKTVPFTPPKVAADTLRQHLEFSGYSVDLDYLHAVDVNDGYGYAAPVTVTGVWQSFFANNKGFMTYDDRPDLPEDKRADTFVEQPYQVGEAMQFFRNAWRKLYHERWFSWYPEILYLHIDPKTPGKFTGVAPRIVYRFHFPFFLPEWEGVTLFDSEGHFTTLSKEEALADPRLSRKRIFPRALVQELVHSQIYDGKGSSAARYASGWVLREGKIKYPNIAEEEMPFVLRGKDGKDYFTVAVEPAGPSSALFRLYDVNSHTGERRVFEFKQGHVSMGPERAIDYVKAVRGFVWAKGDTGTHIPIFPIPVPLRGQIYWKFSVVTQEGGNVAATVVVGGGDVLVFQNRREFDRWLESGEAPRRNNLEKLRAWLDSGLKLIDSLENEAK